MPDDIKQAIRGYKAFREAAPRRALSIDPKLPKAVWRMGACEFVGYMTTHHGEPALYVHEFAAGSRPVLYAGPRRNQLYLFGGRFIVTELGITDLDVNGNVTEAPRRYTTQRLHNRRSLRPRSPRAKTLKNQR